MKGLFAGYGSFLLRDLPFDAIEFVAYEQLKSMYKVRLAAHCAARSRLWEEHPLCRAMCFCLVVPLVIARFLKIPHQHPLKV